MSARGNDGGASSNGAQPKSKYVGAEDQSAVVHLKVKSQDGNEVVFMMKRKCKLKKLMTAYCNRQSLDLNAVAFLFDGRRLRGEQTPEELEMEDEDEDEDEMDAMLHQTRGGCGSP